LTTARRIAGKVLRLCLGTLGVLLAVAALLVGVMWGYARSDAGRRRLVGWLNAEVQQIVPGLHVGRLGGDYLRRLSLEDVTCLDRQGARVVHVERIELVYRLWPLVRRHLEVSSVEIVHPVVEASRTAEGTWNVAELAAPRTRPGPDPTSSPGKGTSSWRVDVHTLRVVGGRAVIRAGEDDEPWMVPALDVEARGHLQTGTSAPRGGVFLDRLALTVERAESHFEVALAGEGGGDGNRLFATVSRLRVLGLPGGPLHLTAQAGGPTEALGLVLDAHNEEGARLALRGRASWQEGALGPYTWSLKAAGLAPAQWVPAAPKGTLALDAEGRGRGVVLAAGTEAELRVIVPSLLRADVHTQGAAVAASLDARLTPELRALLPAGVHAKSLVAVARFDGTWPGDWRSTLHVEGRALEVADDRLAKAVFDAKVAWRSSSGARFPFTGTGTLALSGLAGARLGTFQRATLHVSSDGRGLTLTGDAMGPAAAARLRASGEVGKAGGSVRLAELTWRGLGARGGSQTFDLVAPASLTWAEKTGASLSPLTVRARGRGVAGQATVSGRWFGGAGRRSAKGDLALAFDHVVWGELPPFDMQGRAALDGDHLEGAIDVRAAGDVAVHADLTVPVVNRPRRRLALARAGPIVGHVTSKNADLRRLPEIQRLLARHGLVGGTVDLAMTLTGDVAHPDAQGRLGIKDIEVRLLTGKGRGSALHRLRGLGASLALDTEPGRVRVKGAVTLEKDSLVTWSGGCERDLGVLLARGRDGLRGLPCETAIDVAALDLKVARSLDDRFSDVEGILRGTARLRAELPVWEGHAEAKIENARVDAVRFQDVSLKADGRGARWRVSAHLAQAAGGTLTGDASFDTGAKTMKGELRLTHLDPGFLRLLSPQVRELAGVVDGDLRWEGAFATPAPRGNLYFYQGRLGLIGQPTFSGIGVALSLAPDKITLRELHAYSGGGSLSGKGWVTLKGAAPEHLVATAHAKGFVIAAAGASGAKIDGDLAFEAVMRDSLLRGEAKVPEARVWLPKVVGSGRTVQRIGDREDVRFVDEAGKAAAKQAAADAASAQAAAKQAAAEPATTAGKGAAPAASKTPADGAAAEDTGIDIRAVAGTIYVRGKDLDLELETHLRVRAEQGPARVTGTADIRRGRIMLAGQRFDVERGTIALRGRDEPQMDVRIAHQYPDALVAVELRGTPSHPSLHLVSDPPIYDSAQIISLVLTGQPGGAPSSGSSDPTAAIGTAVLGKIADKIAPEIGLDVVRVENVKETTPEGQATGSTDTRIEVGKYIGSRVYLSYAHVFGAAVGQNLNQAQVEYRASRRWLIETVFGDAGVGGVDALWTYRY
jgi:hypothetical protein